MPVPRELALLQPSEVDGYAAFSERGPAGARRPSVPRISAACEKNLKKRAKNAPAHFLICPHAGVTLWRDMAMTRLCDGKRILIKVNFKPNERIRTLTVKKAG